MERSQAKKLRTQLNRSIERATSASERCLRQVADGDLRWADREHAENRAMLALNAKQELEITLQDLEDAING
jgi:hypothetical protein